MLQLKVPLSFFGLGSMVSPNWQILLSLKCSNVNFDDSYYVKGLFLNSQTIIDIGSIVLKLWLLKDSGGGVLQLNILSTAITFVPLI